VAGVSHEFVRRARGHVDTVVNSSTVSTPTEADEARVETVATVDTVSTPHRSDREIAEAIGVDHKTVAASRHAGVDTVGKFPTVSTPTEADEARAKRARVLAELESDGNVEQCATVALEDAGNSAEDVAAKLNIGVTSYRIARDLVRLADNKRLAGDEASWPRARR
jgi:hypothetical protein